MIDNEKVDEIMIFPSVFVKRESCGCEGCKSSLDKLSDFYVKVIRNYKVHENMQTYSLDELLNQITAALKNYNIKSCFILKYSDGMAVFDREFILPESSELIYSYTNNQRMEIDANSRYFNTTDILPDNLIPDNRRFTVL
jgi:hypothetical protein